MQDGAYYALYSSYDRLNSETDYSAWADFFCAAFEKFGAKKISSVLDLGCGTGAMTFELRQRGFDMELGVDVSVSDGVGGVTVYMCENEHYDIAVRKKDVGYEAVLTLNIGCIKHEQTVIPLKSGAARLIVRADSQVYKFSVDDGEEKALGYGLSKYLSSEVSGGFTGVVLGLYAVNGTSSFENLNIVYKEI